MIQISEKYNTLKSIGFDCGLPIGFVAQLPNGGAFQVYTNATIFYHPVYGAFEVHGAILAHYTLIGGVLSDIGYPISDEEDWWLNNDAMIIGKLSRFQNGVIYYRIRDGKILMQAISNEKKLFWGIDCLASFKEVVEKGNLLNKTLFTPCFRGIYLPILENDFLKKADDIHNTFLYTNGLTKIFFIDNKNQKPEEKEYSIGKGDAIDACRRAEFLIDHYLAIDEIKANIVGFNMPANIPIFCNIEPNWKRHKSYLEGWQDGFFEYNSGNPIVKYIPGVYISFTHISNNFNYGLMNLGNINGLNNNSLLIWCQHPNLKNKNESNIFNYGFQPDALSKVVSLDRVVLWQFNNFDIRFIWKTWIDPITNEEMHQYWIDHDLSTEIFYKILWEGDERQYKV